jgi:hypothetical protein
VPSSPKPPSPSWEKLKGEGGIRERYYMHYNKKVFARELRKDSTPEENHVWDLLRNRKFKNLKFRRDYVIIQSSTEPGIVNSANIVWVGSEGYEGTNLQGDFALRYR